MTRKPLSAAPSYPVSAGVAAMAIAITALSMMGTDISPLTMNANAFWQQPWRLVSSALPHGGIIHLLFNVYWLWILGTTIEDVFGHALTLALVVVFAAGSAAGEYALFRGGIGLSGVVYGLVGMVYVLSRRDRRFMNAIDQNTALMFVGWFFLCIVLTVTKVWAIANVAHGVGAVLGVLAGLALARPTSYLVPIVSGRRHNDGLKPWGYIGFVAVMALSLLGATVFRDSINLSSHRDYEYHRRGIAAIEAGDPAAAVDAFRAATDVNPNNAQHWYNLGVAYHRMQQLERAHTCFERAALLEPSNPRYREAAR